MCWRSSGKEERKMESRFFSVLLKGRLCLSLSLGMKVEVRLKGSPNGLDSQGNMKGESGNSVGK
jgi:hypothetical protein